MSATDRAFQLPELLAAILKRVQMTERSRDRDRSLLACCLVNSIWFSAAMPLLWASPTDRYVVETMWPTLPLLFSRIEPARRQMYADAVKNACLMSAERFAPYDEAIQGVSFPALRTLTVYLDDGHHVPTVKGHQVRGLTLNPRFDVNPDTYGVDRDDIETILDQIATLFPKLEEVDFADRAMAHAGAMQRFESRLPRLTNFDHSQVTETDELSDWF